MTARAGAIVLACTVAAALLSAPRAGGTTGLGTATVSPSSVVAASTSNTFTFTYTAPSGGLSDGAVTISGPPAWTTPGTLAGSAGYTTTSTGDLVVSPPGTADTLSAVAGKPGSSGCTGTAGPATGAQLSRPDGVVLDADDDLWFSDPGCDTVDVVPAVSGTYFGRSMAAGDLYVVTGTSGSSGCPFSGTTASSDHLGEPADVALDAAGDLYFADFGCNTVDMVPSVSGTYFGQSMTAGDLYILAGESNRTNCPAINGVSPTGTALNGPEGVVVDGQGNLYLAAAGCDSVYEVPAVSGTYFGRSMTAGDLYEIVGGPAQAGCGGAAGPATQAYLSDPMAVALDAHGNLYIANTGCDVVDLVADVSGTYFGRSMSAGDIYVVAGTTSSSGCTGAGGPATSATLTELSGVAVDGRGDLLVSVAGCDTVDVVAASSTTSFGQTMTAGDLYVVGGRSSASGCATTAGSATSADLSAPAGVAVDAEGDVYLSDPGSCAVVQEITASGDWTLTVSQVSLLSGQTLTLTWGAGGGPSGVTGPSVPGTTTFPVAESPSLGALPTELASPPSVLVTAVVAPFFVSTPTAPSVEVALGGGAPVVTATSTADVGNTGWESGWSISATATPFSCAPGTGSCAAGSSLGVAVTVPAGSPPTVSCDGGPSSCTPAVTSLSYPLTLPVGTGPPAAVPVFTAESSTGVGDQTVTFTWRESLPADAYTGSYDSTWTYTLSDGP